jgi:hypothetical protein
MNCDDCRERLQVRLDGAALAEDDLEAHLSGCPECRALDAAARRLVAGLLLTAAPAPPPDLAGRIAVCVINDQRRLRRLRRGLVLAGAVGVAASLLLGLLLVPTDSQRTSWVAQKWESVLAFFNPPYVVTVVNLPDTDIDVDPKPPASLNDNAAEATSAVASLARRTADETLSDGQLLLPSLSLSLPPDDMLTPALDPPATSLREAGQGVATGLEPVATSARRAFDLFRRDIVPLTPEAKSGL